MTVDYDEGRIKQTVMEVFEAFFEGVNFIDLRGVRANGGEGIFTGEGMKVEFWQSSIDQPSLLPSTITSTGTAES
jgi:hypothetical protein